MDTSDGSCKVWSRGKRYFAGEPILVAREANLSGGVSVSVACLRRTLLDTTACMQSTPSARLVVHAKEIFLCRAAS